MMSIRTIRNTIRQNWGYPLLALAGIYMLAVAAGGIYAITTGWWAPVN